MFCWGLTGTGLKLINGLLGYAQAHLTVHKTGSLGGIDVDLRENKPPPIPEEGYRPVNWKDKNRTFDLYRPIWPSQFSKFNGIRPNNAVTNDGGFMLITSNIASEKVLICE